MDERDTLYEAYEAEMDQIEKREKGRFSRGRRKLSRDEILLSHVRDDNLIEYLELEQRRLESIQQAKESRNEKLFSAFRLAILLAAVVLVIYFLKDNPIVLVNILYIFGIVGALWLWKNPRAEKEKKKEEK